MRPRRRRWLLVLRFVACCVPLGAYMPDCFGFWAASPEVVFGVAGGSFRIAYVPPDNAALLVDVISDLGGKFAREILPSIRSPVTNLTWFTVPAWTVSAVLSAAVLVLARFTRPRRAAGCFRCGYDLTGNVSGVCPECGTLIHSPAPPLCP